MFILSNQILKFFNKKLTTKNMSHQSDKTISDLLSKCLYKYKDITKRDIQGALSYFKDLIVKTDKYVYHTGIFKELVCLAGTIPVNFKNNVYNIPVQVFLSDTHPYDAPMSYVRPTPDMSINVSKTVDPSGRINLPYISEWRHPNSDLYTLLNCMAFKFAEETPLYSKMSRPTSSIASPGTASVTVQSNTTPYPTSYNQPSSMPPYPLDSFPMRPTYPAQVTSSFPINAYQSYVDPTIPSYGSSSQFPNTNRPYYPMTSPPQPMSHLKSGSSSTIGQTRPAYNPMNPSANTSLYSDDTIKPEHYRMSLISAVQDKLRHKFADVYDEKMAEIDSLKRVRNDLEQSKQSLNILINDAENESLNIKQLTDELKSRRVQLNEGINRMQHRDKANIEDAVVTPMPLYRQILQLFAEEMSIQDLVFYLSEGLTHKTISLENYLKQIRMLSRKQFYLRATMHKAREQAALPL